MSIKIPFSFPDFPCGFTELMRRGRTGCVSAPIFYLVPILIRSLPHFSLAKYCLTACRNPSACGGAALLHAELRRSGAVRRIRHRCPRILAYRCPIQIDAGKNSAAADHVSISARMLISVEACASRPTGPAAAEASAPT